MLFDQTIKYILEQTKDNRAPEPEPWSLEIKKDFSKSDAYNELGDLIIKLFELRSRLE
jgi:hypothetical protein